MKQLALLFAVALWSGCSRHDAKLMGVVPGDAPIPVSAALAGSPDSQVLLHGVITEKCPVAGCWFMLHDESGTIKVDTKNAGFTVVDVPLRSALVVAGRVTTNGTHRIIDASGIRY